jgi:hypothetical protein
MRDALSPEPFPDAPPGPLARAVLAMRRRLIALADALVPAEVALLEKSIGVVHTERLGAAARLGIADRLADGPKDAATLARETGVSADALHRALRELARIGVFSLGADGRFENNRLSSALRSGSLARSREWCTYFASDANVRAWSDFDETLRTGKSAFPRQHGESVWNWFDHHPGDREVFAQAMMGVTVGMAPVVASIYPFAEVRTVCDVGGGRGTLLSELLVRHRHLQGVLCDGEGVLESARVLLERRGVLGRVQLVPGNFFARVPTGADAYVLKNVLHDWDDERALAILKTVRAAMAPGARILIAETLCEPNQTDGFAPFSDVQMMVVCDEGRERSQEEYRRLLGKAGVTPGRIFESPIVSVMEGRA